MKSKADVLEMFSEKFPHQYEKHMFSWFSLNASRGVILPFTMSLMEALWVVESVCAGFAAETIDRMAAIGGKGEDQFESLMQICAEVFIAAGAADVVDADDGDSCFRHEPRSRKCGKNPEFEFRYDNVWIAVEVKTPKLLKFERDREKNSLQLTARIGKMAGETDPTTPPRDNPIKDFLASAEAKFIEYQAARPDAIRLLAIMWTDFVQEPVSALLSPVSGLLTPNSFNKDAAGAPIEYPHIDGIVLYRNLRVLQEAAVKAGTPAEPLMPFHYARGAVFPPKVLIQNPKGRAVPDIVLDALDLTRIEDLSDYAEYQPMELIMWLNSGSGDTQGNGVPIK